MYGSYSRHGYMIMSFLVGLSCIEKGRIVGHIHIQGAQLELKIYTV